MQLHELSSILKDYVCRESLTYFDERLTKLTNHDMKAVECFLKTKCQEDPEISKVCIYFLCTFIGMRKP